MTMRSVAFLDESGDESARQERGASALFVVGLAVFPDPAEARRCSARIDALRTELGKPSRYEFHFRSNSDAIRRAFLLASAPFAFTYHAVVLDKPNNAVGHLPLYVGACAAVCALASETLMDSLLIVDAGQKDKLVRRRRESEIRRQVNDQMGRSLLREVRAQDSVRNNLVQLADYVTGVARWHAEGRRGSAAYRSLIVLNEGRIRRDRV